MDVYKWFTVFVRQACCCPIRKQFWIEKSGHNGTVLRRKHWSFFMNGPWCDVYVWKSNNNLRVFLLFVMVFFYFLRKNNIFFSSIFDQYFYKIAAGLAKVAVLLDNWLIHSSKWYCVCNFRFFISLKYPNHVLYFHKKIPPLNSFRSLVRKVFKYSSHKVVIIAITICNCLHSTHSKKNSFRGNYSWKYGRY